MAKIVFIQQVLFEYLEPMYLSSFKTELSRSRSDYREWEKRVSGTVELSCVARIGNLKRWWAMCHRNAFGKYGITKSIATYGECYFNGVVIGLSVGKCDFQGWP